MRAFTALILLFATLVLWSQQWQYPYRQYTTEDGLCQIQVVNLFIDAQGNVWCGTHNGVSRFNGEKFHNFTAANDFPEGRVHSIRQDSIGRIWAATTSYLSILEGDSVRNITLPFSAMGWQLVIEDTIPWMIPGGNAGIREEIRYWEDGTWNLASGRFPDLKDVVDSEMIILPQTHHFLFTTYSDGLLVFDSSGVKLDQYEFPKHTMPYVQYNPVLERVLVIVCDTNLGEQIVYSFDDSLSRVLWTYDVSRDLYDAKTAQMARFTSYYNVIREWDSTQMEYVELPYLAFNSIRGMNFESETDLWVASDEGLIQVITNGMQRDPDPPCSYIWSVVGDNLGNTFLGCYLGGVIQFGYDGSVRNWPLTPWPTSENQIFPGSAVGPRGEIFFGGNFGFHVKTERGMTSIYEEEIVEAFYVDTPHNELIVGTREMVCKYDLSTVEKIECIKLPPSVHKSAQVTCIVKEQDRKFWIGTPGGMCLMNINDGSSVSFTQENNKLPCRGVMSMYNRHGAFWLGGTNGLYILESDSSISPMLPEVIYGTIFAFHPLDSIHLLVAGERELFVLKIHREDPAKSILIGMYNRTNGFDGIEPSQNGMWEDPAGRVWIPSATGLHSLEKRRLVARVPRVKPHIISIAGASTLKGLIDIPYGENSVILRYEGVGIQRRIQTQYQYRIDGQPWSAALDDEAIYLGNLGHGRHQIDLRVMWPDTDEKEWALDSALFNIHLPIWKRNWFIPATAGLSLIAIAFAALLFIRSRIYRLRYERDHRHLQLLQIQTLQAQLNPHFLFNVLGSIQNTIMNRSKEQAIKQVVKLSHIMRGFLESFIHSDPTGIVDASQEITLKEELDFLKMYIEFEQLQYRNKLNYSIEVDPVINVEYVRIPPLVIQPFVENAIKHGILLKDSPGNLSLVIHAENESICVFVKDDGVGRKKAKEIQTASRKIYTSRGKKLVDQRIGLLNELGRKISVETYDRENGGTEVMIKFQSGMQ